MWWTSRTVILNLCIWTSCSDGDSFVANVTKICAIISGNIRIVAENIKISRFAFKCIVLDVAALSAWTRQDLISDLGPRQAWTSLVRTWMADFQVFKMIRLFCWHEAFFFLSKKIVENGNWSPVVLLKCFFWIYQ